MGHVIRLACTAFFLSCAGWQAWGQAQKPPAPMRVDVDYARFRGDEANAYVEVYYSFPQNSLTYKNDAEGFTGEIEVTVTVVAKDSLYFAERVKIPHHVKELADNPMNLVSNSKMMLRPGAYTLKVLAVDVHDPARRDSAQMKMAVTLPPEEHVVLSDIEFASNIVKGKQGSAFYKNTLDVIPNADGVYSSTQKCFYYAEAYNLLRGDDKSDLKLKVAVYNAIGKEVISRERPRRRSAESTVLVDNLDIADLRTGRYTLVLSLHDSARILTSSSKKFYVYNAALGIDSSLLKLDPAISLSVFSTMEEPELDREFKWLKWQAEPAESEQYEGLHGVVAKRKFLADFWSKRPLGLRDTYLKRVAYANRTFAVLNREGYRTDRGRVYIVYGPPDDIERHPNQADTRPYEIWYFNNIQGGVQFVFVLRQDGGDYELVHSTHRNEMHDENWARFAQTN